VNNRKTIVLYARAFTTGKGAESESAFNVVQLLAAAVGSSVVLIRFLNHPGIGVAEKMELLQTCSAIPFKGAVKEILELMLKGRKAALLPEIVEEMGRLRLAHQGISEVVVTTTFVLPDAQRAAIHARLAAALHGKMKADYQVDPQMIAGMRVRIGNTVYDNTAQSALSDIHNSFNTVFGR
jgi:F-type H+-transporting ATPase subunit delta